MPLKCLFDGVGVSSCFCGGGRLFFVLGIFVCFMVVFGCVVVLFGFLFVL